MSGLVSTYAACRRTQSRDSVGVSPSYVAARTASESEPAEGAQLVGGQRLGGREVQRGRRRRDTAGVGRLEHRRQRGQQVAERLAGRGAGGDHGRAPRPDQLGGLDLVRPRSGDAGGGERLRPPPDAPRPASRPVDRAARDALDVGEPVAPAGRAISRASRSSARLAAGERVGLRHLGSVPPATTAPGMVECDRSGADPGQQARKIEPDQTPIDSRRTCGSLPLDPYRGRPHHRRGGRRDRRLHRAPAP